MGKRNARLTTAPPLPGNNANPASLRSNGWWQGLRTGVNGNISPMTMRAGNKSGLAAISLRRSRLAGAGYGRL